MIPKEQLNSLINDVINESAYRLLENSNSYSHWISTDGTMVDVSYSHEITAKEIVRDLISKGKIKKEELSSINYPMSSTTETESLLFNRGWVRGVRDAFQYYYVNGQPRQRLTPKQIRALVEHGRQHRKIVEFLPGGEGHFKGVEHIYNPEDMSQSLNESIDRNHEKVARFFISNVWRVMEDDDKFSPYQFSLWMDSNDYLTRMRTRMAKELYPNDGEAEEKFFEEDIKPTLENLEQKKYARLVNKINTSDPLFLLKNVVKRKKTFEAAKKELFNSNLFAGHDTNTNISDEEAQTAFERLYRHAMGETAYGKDWVEKFPRLADLKQPNENTTERLFVQHYAGWKTEGFPEVVRVWRGTNSPTHKIKPGDFVTFDRDFADSYARGKFRAIIQGNLPSKDLRVHSMDIDSSQLVYWPEGHDIKTYTGTIPSFKEFWATFR